MWNKIIGLKLYNDINRLSKYLKINTNIQQNKFYFNKIVAENAKKEYDNLDKKSQDEFMVEFNEKDWSKRLPWKILIHVKRRANPKIFNVI